jgi:feruloyl-CoA synthase
VQKSHLTISVVAAPNREYLTALIFPNLPPLRARFSEASVRYADDAAFPQYEEVRAFFAEIFAQHNRQHVASSYHFLRCLRRMTPPRLDHNETTDKGYINQIAVLHNRAELVEKLYQEPPDPDIIILR